MKVGIIGLGRVGYEFGLDKNRGPYASHFHCYQKLGAEIAVCENNDLKYNSFVNKNYLSEKPVEVFSSYALMFSDFAPEIVSICTPTGTHKDIALAATNCPSVQTIFLEKPIAQSLGEADEIIRACKDNNVRLAVNYSRRWSKRYGYLKEESKAPMYLVGMHPGPLIRTGTHMIDVFNWLIEPEVEWDKVEVQAFGETKFASYMSETEDFNVNGYINYGSSKAILMGNVQSIPSNAVVFELTVWNTDMEFKVSENGCRTDMYGLSESKRYANLCEYHHVYTGEGEPENLLLNAITELSGQIGAGRFTCTPESGYELKPKPIACSGVDARRDLQVALALHYSATHGNKPISLKDVPYDYHVKSI